LYLIYFEFLLFVLHVKIVYKKNKKRKGKEKKKKI